MEIMYPMVLILCIIISLVLIFINLKKKSKYTDGKKIANTQYIKNTEYYQSKVKEYNILSNVIKVLSAICIVVTGVLIARPVTLQTQSDNKNNRDIILDIDVSTSESEVNLQLVRKFKKMLPNIKRR